MYIILWYSLLGEVKEVLQDAFAHAPEATVFQRYFFVHWNFSFILSSWMVSAMGEKDADAQEIQKFTKELMECGTVFLDEIEEDFGSRLHAALMKAIRESKNPRYRGLQVCESLLAEVNKALEV